MAIQDIPTLQRNVEVRPSSTPDFQSTFEKLGESENSLSAIGAQVAQTASNEMASELGTISGKNPRGTLMPPVTEFDKNFQESYNQQASATLQTQAEKLLTDTQVIMAKAQRLTPELIANTTQQLQTGLSKISSQAPIGIQGELQKSFSSQLLQHTMQYNERMVREQREDQKDNLQNGMDIATKNALEAGKNGDLKGSTNAVDSVKKMADSALASHFITPEEARIAKETAVQTGLNGQYINQAMQAFNEGKFPDWQKKYSDSKPSGMTNEQWIATGKAVNDQINFVQTLRKQGENLKAQDILNKIAVDPNSISGSDWNTFASSVSPMLADKVKFHWIQAKKRAQGNEAGTDLLIHNWASPTAHANSTPKLQNAAFNKQVTYTINEGNKSGNPISAEDAEVQVAANAGSTIPVFTKEIQNKLQSGNPAMMISAANQIHRLRQMNAGHALTKLTQQDNILNDTFSAKLDGSNPVTAAKESVATVLNQDPDVLKSNKQRWAEKIRVSTSAGVPGVDLALNTFNLKKDQFFSPAIAQNYGADILRNYQTNYLLAGGDDSVAKKATQRYIDDTYGQTGVNGGYQMAKNPIEKVLGYSDPRVVPYIQQDVINQFNKQFIPIKKLYDDKKSNVYYETVPLTKLGNTIASPFENIPWIKNNGVADYNPIQIIRHERIKNGSPTIQKLNVVLTGNDFDWDVGVQTNTGLKNLYREAPFLGILRYQPNAKAIHDAYAKDHYIK